VRIFFAVLFPSESMAINPHSPFAWYHQQNADRGVRKIVSRDGGRFSWNTGKVKIRIYEAEAGVK